MTADRCPCGEPIYANTEDWEIPLCYECYIEMSEKLLPCPFCGSDNLQAMVCTIRHIYHIECKECLCNGPLTSNRTTDLDKGDKEAIKHWNTRYQPRCEDCRFDDGTYCAVLEIKTPSRFVEVDYSDFYCAKFEIAQSTPDEQTDTDQ